MSLREFGVHVFDDDAPGPKLDPAGLPQAAKAVGVSIGSVLYVGDSASDLKAAEAARA